MESSKSFDDIFPEEIVEIDRRRALLGQPPLSFGRGGVKPSSDVGLVGLCLSGGGIRSASFNFGVVAAAVETGVLSKIDYLSTVSGGGYIGASVSVSLASAYTAPDATTGPQKFPLHSDCAPKALEHIRRNVNYLAPGGFADLASILLSLLAGMIAQGIALLPYFVLCGWFLAVVMEFVGDPKARRWDHTWSAARPAWIAFGGVLVIIIYFRSRYRSSLSTTASFWPVVVKGTVALLAFTVAAFLPTLVTITQDLIAQPKAMPALGMVAAAAGIALIAARALWMSGSANVRRVGLLAAAVVGPLVGVAIIIMTARWAWFGYDLFRPEDKLTTPSGDALAPPEVLIRCSRAFRDTVLFVGSLLVLHWYSAAIDANSSSMHTAYRNALSRTFLFQVDGDKAVTQTWKSEVLRTLVGERKLTTSVDRMRLSELSVRGGAAPYH